MCSALMRTLFLACLMALTALAAPGEVGNPSIRSFRPRDYGAQNQNWAFQQDARGLIYVGNGEGVLEFDGVRWRLIPTVARTPIRSLAMDGNGRIYVGAVGEVGYLAPDAQGSMVYVSLNDRIDSAHAKFADVWKIHPTSRGIYFFTSDFIFLLAPDGFRSWQVETPLHLAFGVGERFLVQQMDVGLMELDGQGLAPIPCGDFFKHEKIYFILPWDPPQPGQNPRLLIGTRGKGLFLYDGASLTPFPTEADRFLKEHLLYPGALLPDGSLALGTLQGGTAIVSREGRLRMIVDKRTGLPDTSVYALYPDRQGGLWMGLGSGISRLQWPAAFSNYDAGSGLEGSVLAIHRHGRELYVGTSLGLFRLEPQGPGRLARFRQVPGLQAQTWGLHSAGDSLLASNYQGLFEIRDGKATLLQGGANAFITHPDGKDGQRLYLGMVGAMASLRRQGPGGPWVKEGPLPGIQETIRTIVDDGEGRLWLGTSGRETLRVSFPAAGPRSPGVPFVERFGASQGLPVKHGLKVAKVGGRVVFGTGQGIFQFAEATRSFQPDPRFRRYFLTGPKRVLLVEEDPAGRVWLETRDETTSQHEVALGSLAGDGEYRWETAPFLRFSNSEVICMLPEADGIVWFGSADGLSRYDPAIPMNAGQAFRAHVRGVFSKSGALLHGGAPGAAPVFTLKAGSNALRFEFSATSFDSEWTNQYQIHLDGYDHAWSPWSSTPFKEYSYLPEGRYLFRVRARNVFGTLSEEGLWAFSIETPWYRAWWARCLLLGAAASAILSGYGVFTRLLRSRNASLQRRVAEATLELHQREVKLATQARDLELANEKLLTINEQKDQFIGIVAHDLRNPLNGIMLASEMLEDIAETPPVATTARMIQTECRDMDALIGRFLDISAIEAGTIKSEPTPCSLADLARQIAGRHGLRAEQKGIQIRLDLAPDTRLAFVDLNFAKEILDNLLSNAVKFSPFGTAVTLRLRNARDRVLLTVEDQGPGLTLQDQTRLFNRFTKLSASPTGGERSLGLGLSIVKHMVDAMNGKIWVVTAPGEGAAFHVEFPAAL